MKIKGYNRKKRKREKDRMQIDNRNIFQLERIKKKKRDQILRKQREQKDERVSAGEIDWE
jgi:hypothetical protein